MNYSLNMGEWNSVFAVPSSVVDKYIKLASGDSLKLLLYLLRHGGETVSEDVLKKELGFSGFGELEDAALFWVQRGILSYENTASKMALEPSADAHATPAVPAQPQVSEPQTPAVKVNEKPIVVSSGEAADRIKSDKGLQMLFSEAEKLYGHPLNQRETGLLMGLNDHYCLNAGVSVMLLNYCFRLGKTSPAYINSVAENWAKEGINTIALANERILCAERQNKICEKLRSEMGLKTNFTPKMTEFVRVWTEDWGFDMDMIMFAYNKTVDSIGGWKPSYANKILENLHSQGIKTVDAAKKADEERRKQNSFGESRKKDEGSENSSFSVDDLMSSLISTYNKN